MTLMVKEAIERADIPFLDNLGYSFAKWTKAKLDIPQEPSKLVWIEKLITSKSIHNEGFHHGNNWSKKLRTTWIVKNLLILICTR